MHRTALLFATAISLAIAPVAHSSNAAIRIDVSGSYSSNWGAVTLRQNGNHVSGTYVYQDGQIDGAIDGNVMTYTWREHGSVGHGVFVVATNGQLIGTWGVNDDISGGGWRLAPIASSI